MNKSFTIILVIFIVFISSIQIISNSQIALSEETGGAGGIGGAGGETAPPPAERGNIVDISFPGIPERGPGIAGYISDLYKFALVIGGILAVGMIVIGAIYISVSGTIDKQKEGKSYIMSAIWGLVLLFGSYLILQTVNPRLVALEEPTIKKELKPVIPTSVSQCNDFNDININIGAHSGGIPAENCKIRRVKTGNYNVEISSDGYYSKNEAIPPNSIIWLYPYYKSNPLEDAKCLIYAYRKLGEEEETKKVDLKKDIKLCPYQLQESGVSPGEIPFEDCDNCEQISGVPHKGPNQACASDVCKLNKDLLGKLKTLYDQTRSADWWITEAWPPTIEHQSQCHNNGTCVDIALKSFISPITDCPAVGFLETKAKELGLNVLNEYPYLFDGCRGSETEYAVGAGHLHVSY